MHILRLVLWHLGLAIVAMPLESQQLDPVQRLGVLIGSWDVDDVYRSANGSESREQGVRTCAYVLLERYVECTTKARSASGRAREYRWLLNFNSQTRRYDLTAIFSNVTFKVHQTIQIDSTGTVWQIRSAPYLADGVEQWTGAILKFDGTDRAVWTGYRNFDTTAVNEWVQSTRETWVRRRPEEVVVVPIDASPSELRETSSAGSPARRQPRHTPARTTGPARPRR